MVQFVALRALLLPLILDISLAASQRELDNCCGGTQTWDEFVQPIPGGDFSESFEDLGGFLDLRYKVRWKEAVHCTQWNCCQFG